MIRSLCAAAVSIAALSAASIQTQRPAVAQTASTACGRTVILLAGYNTSSASAGGVFSQVVSAVTGRLGYARMIQYSYSYPAPYTASATYAAFPNTSVDALHRTVAAEIERCPQESIDLIGHSLGGVVALQYLARYSTSPEGSHIRHSIMLDSPVNGSSYGRLIVAASLLNEQRLVGSPTGMFLAAEHDNPATRGANVALARRLAPRTLVTTLSSRDDWIVPPGDATIAGFDQEFSLGRNYAACTRGLDAMPSCLGHDRILHSTTSLNAIRTALGR